jgi:hypothetical protein
VSGVPRSAARQQFEARAAGIGRLGAHLVDDLLPRLRRLGTLDRQRRSRCNSPACRPCALRRPRPSPGHGSCTLEVLGMVGHTGFAASGVPDRIGLRRQRQREREATAGTRARRKTFMSRSFQRRAGDLRWHAQGMRPL